MTFDPSKFGATPVSRPTETGSFDPSKFGATPIQKLAPIEEKPKMTLGKVLGTAQKVANTVFPGKQVGEAIGTLGGYAYISAREKLGLEKKGTTANYDLSAPTPLQTTADAANIGLNLAGIKGLGSVGSLARRTAVSGALGAGIGATKSIAEGQSTEETVKNAATGGAIAAAVPIVGAGLQQFGKLMGATGDKIQTTVIKPTRADIKDGFSIETVNKYRLGGSLKESFEKTDNILDTFSKELKTKLASSNASINLNQAYENTLKRTVGAKLESFGSNSSMQKAIEQLKQEISSVAGENGLVSIPEAQTVKRASGHFGAWLFGVADPESTARQKVYNTFYNELKNEIERNSPDGVREINKQMSEIIPVMNALIRRIPVAERNSALSLTDIISLTAATVEPRALALTAANFASKSGKVGAGLSRMGAGLAKDGAVRTTLGSLTKTLGPNITNQPGTTVPEQGISPQSQLKSSESFGSSSIQEKPLGKLTPVKNYSDASKDITKAEISKEAREMIDRISIGPLGAVGGFTKAASILKRLDSNDIRVMSNFVKQVSSGRVNLDKYLNDRTVTDGIKLLQTMSKDLGYKFKDDVADVKNAYSVFKHLLRDTIESGKKLPVKKK